jgi:toxin-antitoxin system PIN domain toxin
LIAVDTNLLVYAHRRDSQWHKRAAACLHQLAEGPGQWAIPWPCVHEFIAISTHIRIYSPPSSTEQAMRQVALWLESPTVVLLGEAPGYLQVLKQLLEEARISGPRMHDARVAALCLFHGIQELWTADRDFSAFPSLRSRNPLIAS